MKDAPAKDIDTPIKILYDSICGPAGQERKWEVAFADYESQRKGRRDRIPNMRRLTKPEDTHSSERHEVSDLDHIIASAQLEFEHQPFSGDTFHYGVLLQGWCDFPEDSEECVRCASDISDHCLLFYELKLT